MFDSTMAADIPAGSALVGGYVDGSSAWAAADWLRFPGQILVRICVFNDRLDAQVIDIEPGNNDARGAVPWIQAKWLRGDIPTVYCFSDQGPVGFQISEVRAACDAASVKRPLFWIAQWDNNPGTFDPAGDPQIVGKQYANSLLTGGHYDASVIADHWPGVDAMPNPGDPVTHAELEAYKAALQQQLDATYAKRTDPVPGHRHDIPGKTITLLGDVTGQPKP
jgi:hypothetical protein